MIVINACFKESRLTKILQLLSLLGMRSFNKNSTMPKWGIFWPQFSLKNMGTPPFFLKIKAFKRSVG